MVSGPLIILLTHNRPKILKRCISTAINHSKIAYNAYWIVLDDSNPEHVLENLDVLNEFANLGLDVIHLTESKQLEIFKIISTHTLNKDYEILFEKSFHRDISGLRNFGLFLHFIFKSDLTFFLDDDMISCSNSDKVCFFDYAQKTFDSSENCIIGSTLMGILDESYVGRFAYLANHDMNSIFQQDIGLSYSENEWTFENNPLWIDSIPSAEECSTHTSAGLLGFKLNYDSVIPFPSGYNEDWNWCLLQTALYGTKINKTELIAHHSPPSFFKPKQEGILWEMMGECIFDLILQSLKLNNSSTLKDIETKIKPNDVIDKKIGTLDSLIDNVEKHIETFSQIKKQELKDYILQIKNARNSLKNSNILSLVNLWFSDLSKRSTVFSSMIQDDDLCNQIRISLEFVKQKKNVAT